ncbi:metal ABC transporter permease [Vibrio sinaloensis]|nr:metal ABC transporter permease [Vibrio sinaloensis]
MVIFAAKQRAKKALNEHRQLGNFDQNKASTAEDFFHDGPNVAVPLSFYAKCLHYLLGYRVTNGATLLLFLVMKGWALMGDAVSHAVLPGIVLAYVTGLPLLLGAFAAGMLCSFF